MGYKKAERKKALPLNERERFLPTESWEKWIRGDAANFLERTVFGGKKTSNVLPIFSNSKSDIQLIIS